MYNSDQGRRKQTLIVGRADGGADKQTEIFAVSHNLKATRYSREDISYLVGMRMSFMSVSVLS